MTDVVMPQMGESIVEGTLTKWLKKPGEHVERDEPLFEISTDKVDTEIPSPAAGTLSEVLVEEGKTVGINTVVARIDEGGGACRTACRATRRAARAAAAAAPPPPPPPAARAAAGQAAPPRRRPSKKPPSRTGPLSPLVRRMAREYSIDLSKVKGTGAGGRITKQDLEGHIARSRPPPAAPPSSRLPPPCKSAPCKPLPPPVQAAPRRAGNAASARRRTSQGARRADEHHAHPHRRAHARQQTHLGARHHHT